MKPKPIKTDPPLTLPPNTTLQEDIVTSGQRRINMIWEVSQSLIALAVTGAIIYTAVHGTPQEVLTNAFFLIVGFYFSRTNHQAIGGTGNKPVQPYEGR